MIYPNDIKNKQFSKSFSGYKMEEVDLFLDAIAQDYTKMLTDNAELIKKIEVVVAKLEEYRTNEESISNALLNAQKINEQVIREGKNKAELIIREATFKAERLVKNAKNEVDKEQETLEALRKEVSNFKSRLFSIYRSHLDLIENLPSVEEEKSEEPEASEVSEAPAEEIVAQEPVVEPIVNDEEEISVFTPEETVTDNNVKEEETEETEEAEDEEGEQLYFGGAAERFKDIDIKFGADYDYRNE